MSQDGENAAPPILKWAIITLHPSLPDGEEQLAGAIVWGLRNGKLGGEINVGPFTWEDVRKVKTTDWPAKLPKRASFIARRKLEHEAGIEGLEVFFATPLCVGFSKAHAGQTIRDLWDAGCAVYVHLLAQTYRVGDDIAELLQKVEREAQTAHTRLHRKRKAAKKAKAEEKAEARRLAAERKSTI